MGQEVEGKECLWQDLLPMFYLLCEEVTSHLAQESVHHLHHLHGQEDGDTQAGAGLQEWSEPRPPVGLPRPSLLLLQLLPSSPSQAP